MCGENQGKLPWKHPNKGSPPRVRGKRCRSSRRLRRSRITPACAGKTARRLSTKSCTRDHPRVCGENERSRQWCPVKLGSPPRVRGKPALLAAHYIDCRITPACAGKTLTERTGDNAGKDHPRVCGENEKMPVRFSQGRGSPPRVRGKLYPADKKQKGIRITPACAGKTLLLRRSSGVSQDHPRVCGENLLYQLVASPWQGSPPRVRGKHFGNGVFPWLILVLSLNPL